MIPADTTPEAQAVQDRIHREMSLERRLAIVSDLSLKTRAAARQRLAAAHPGLDARQIQLRMIQEIHGVAVGR